MKKTLILLLDAVREDYLKHMPFLTSLKKSQTYLDMIPSVGYSNGAHATIWSGLNQDKHDRFLIYFHRKNSKYFKRMAFFMKLCPKKLRAYFISVLKLPYYTIKFLRTNTPKWYKKTIIDYPPGMPPEIGNFIATGGFKPKHKQTLFSILNDNYISWITQTDTNNYYFRNSPPVDCSKFKITDSDVDFFYFYFADGLGHQFGVHSNQLILYLHKIDKKIKNLFEIAKTKYKDFNYFVFSDHGMVKIDDFIDIKSYLDKSNLVHGKDYIAFYDATMVRFWILNKNKEQILLKILKKLPKSTFMTKKLIKKYGLDFKDNKWFDYMVVLDPGVRPFPDYFVPIKRGIKAYHGYLPKVKQTQGIFITNTFKTKKTSIDIVDIFPTFLNVLKLKKYTPENIDGKSIF